MDLKTYKYGDMDNNVYLLQSAGECLVVDPGGILPDLIQEISNSKKVLRYILLTHGHYDHVLGVKKIKQKFPVANILAGEKDIKLLEQLSSQGEFTGRNIPEFNEAVTGVADGETLFFGGATIKVISTPGHTKGSVCYEINGMLFTGDTLFYHNYGRTDLPYSEPKAMKESLAKLLALDESIQVYPGHGKLTSIKEEKNYFLKYNIL